MQQEQSLTQTQSRHLLLINGSDWKLLLSNQKIMVCAGQYTANQKYDCIYFFELLDGLRPSFSNPLASSQSIIGHLFDAVLSALCVVFIVPRYSLFLSLPRLVLPSLFTGALGVSTATAMSSPMSLEGRALSVPVPGCSNLKTSVSLSLTSADPGNRAVSLPCSNNCGDGKHETEPKLLDLL